FISIVIPLLFVAFSVSVADMLRTIRNRVPRTPYAPPILAILVMLLIIQSNAYHGRESLRQLLLMDKPIEGLGNQFAVMHGLLARSITTEDAKIATVWAGNIPYFAHRHAIDLLGKNDRRIAHEPMRTLGDDGK